MDCRGSLGLALCLLSGAVGCQHQVATIGEPGSSSLPVAMRDMPPDPSQIKKASALPKKEPPAAVLVKFADFKVGESLAPDVPPARQQAIRDDARKDYQRALARDPNYVPAYQGLARLYTGIEDHPRAVETYQKALKIAPKNAALWYELGMCHNYQKEWIPAVECLRQAARFDPENRTYVNTLGVVLARVGRYQESLDCFTRGSGEAMGHYKLARTLQHLQQPELSRQQLELALQKDPTLATAQAMASQLNGPPSPPTQPIQRTSYQPEVRSGEGGREERSNSSPQPSLVSPRANTEEADDQAPSQTVVVPPPPTIRLQYVAPAGENEE